MTELIFLEYIINLIILLFFHMHMFQLNSYSFVKHMKWIMKNYKKVSFQILFILMSLVSFIYNSILLKFLTIVFLAFSIFYNFPKAKSKMPLKFTYRVIRMLITESVIFFIIFIIKGIFNYTFIKLIILNILAIIICVVANVINYPLENFIKNIYIRQAKKILKTMPNLIVIGITGSYGKTSVKNFLVKALSTKYQVVTTPKNYNTTMGVVKTIRESLKPFHQIFVCEMGATDIGDIREICNIVNPKIGVITAIGPQHLESFKSIENIIKTKFELLNSVKKNKGTIFLNYNNEYLRYESKQSTNLVSYGINDKKINYNAYDIKSSSKGINFKMLDKSNREINFKTKLVGRHNVVNITGAIAVANHLNISLESLVPCIRELKSVEHRLDVHSYDSLTIIDDSYNSNPISSKSALDTLSEFEGTKIIVTPGLVELGKDEIRYNFEFGKYMTKVCNYIFLVGNEYSKLLLDGINFMKFDKEKIFIVKTPNEALMKIKNLNINGKITVLLENDLPDNYNL